MFELATVLGLGFALGVSLAAPPGPILALCASRTVRNGWLAGFAVPLGATTGDGTHALIMGLGLFPLLAAYPRALATFNLLGAALLLYFAWLAFRAARTPHPELEEGDAETGPTPRHLLVGGFGTGYVLALTSPYNFAWWLGVGTSLFRDYGAAIFVGFFLGILAFSALFVGVVHWAHRRVQGLVTWINYASAVLLVLFGGLVGWRAVGVLFGAA